jgi:hypothetical protein
MFLLQYDRPSFTPIQNNTQNYKIFGSELNNIYVLSLYMNVVERFLSLSQESTRRTDRQTDRNGKSFKKKLPNSTLHTQNDSY